jgi:DNA topoisomerase-1
VGVACPQCGGELVEKRSRRGKPFYGCANYPKCDFATWDKPLPEACPQCGHPYLVEKKTRAKQGIACPNKDCSYQREAGQAEEG